MLNGRKCKDWLQSYLDYTKEQESPSMFHLWVGLSVIASTLQRQVYIDRGYYTLHPNLFVVLVGGSARVKKTTAIGIGISMLKDALPDLCMISQKITPEALILLLVNQTIEKKNCSSGGVIVADELSIFLSESRKDDSLIHLLTKMYDCPDIFDYHTIIRGKETVSNVWMCILAGTTPDWIRVSMPVHAIGGGFTSRVIFVYQFEPERLIPFPKLTEAQKKLRVLLVEDLREINKLKGDYKLTKDAIDWYETWYCDILSKGVGRVDGALDGYYARKHDTLLKVAMCVAASRKSSLFIGEDELEVALTAMNENEKFLPEIMKSVMTTQVGEERAKIHRAILRRGQVSYSDLLRMVSYCMDAKRVNEVITSLLDEDVISEYIKEGKRWFKCKSSRN